MTLLAPLKPNKNNVKTLKC